VRVVVDDGRAARCQPGDHVCGRRVPGVPDVRLECDADHADARAAERLAALVQGLRDEVDDMPGIAKLMSPASSRSGR
jgi:hypothetical protein